MDKQFRCNIDEKLPDDRSGLPAVPLRRNNYQYSSAVSTNNIASYMATDGPCDEAECLQLLSQFSTSRGMSGDPYDIAFAEHWCGDEIIPRLHINGPRRTLVLSPKGVRRFVRHVHKILRRKKFRNRTNYEGVMGDRFGGLE